MTKTFDEVLDEMNADQEPSESIRFMERLRDIYAPTVEMTEGQAKTILDPEQGKNITNLLTDGTPYFDYLFWEPLTDKQVVQAWLHPETIKVVD